MYSIIPSTLQFETPGIGDVNGKRSSTTSRLFLQAATCIGFSPSWGRKSHGNQMFTSLVCMTEQQWTMYYLTKCKCDLSCINTQQRFNFQHTRWWEVLTEATERQLLNPKLPLIHSVVCNMMMVYKLYNSSTIKLNLVSDGMFWIQRPKDWLHLMDLRNRSTYIMNLDIEISM